MAKGGSGKGKKGHGGSSGRGPASPGRAYGASSAEVAKYLASRPELEAPIKAYTGAAYAKINEMLRMGLTDFSKKYGAALTKTTLARAQETQRAVNRTSEAGHTFNGKVTRGMSAHPDEIAKWLARGEIVNRSFWSTSVSNAVSKNFTGNVVLHINQHSGVALAGTSHFKHEKEVLIPAGKRFKITSSRKQGSVTHLYLKQIT